MCVVSCHRRIGLILCSCIEAFQPILLNDESPDLLFLDGHGVGEYVHGLHSLGHSYQSCITIRREHCQSAGSTIENLLLSLNSLNFLAHFVSRILSQRKTLNPNVKSAGSKDDPKMSRSKDPVLPGNNCGSPLPWIWRPSTVRGVTILFIRALQLILNKRAVLHVHLIKYRRTVLQFQQILNKRTLLYFMSLLFVRPASPTFGRP